MTDFHMQTLRDSAERNHTAGRETCFREWHSSSLQGFFFFLLFVLRRHLQLDQNSVKVHFAAKKKKKKKSNKNKSWDEIIKNIATKQSLQCKKKILLEKDPNPSLLRFFLSSTLVSRLSFSFCYDWGRFSSSKDKNKNIKRHSEASIVVCPSIIKVNDRYLGDGEKTFRALE